MDAIVVTINGQDKTLEPEEFHPYEPSAYVYDPGWTAYDAEGVEFFVSVSGDVFKQPGNESVGRVTPAAPKYGKSVDADLRSIFVFHPRGVPEVKRLGGIDVYHYADDYGPPPYRFRPCKQNGSRVHLRLIDSENRDQRYGEDVEYVAGQYIERRAYSSDLRGGVYWTREP